jgi:hypothetical protein
MKPTPELNHHSHEASMVSMSSISIFYQIPPEPLQKLDKYMEFMYSLTYLRFFKDYQKSSVKQHPCCH